MHRVLNSHPMYTIGELRAALDLFQDETAVVFYTDRCSNLFAEGIYVQSDYVVIGLQPFEEESSSKEENDDENED